MAILQPSHNNNEITDLVWTLDEFAHQKLAANFVKRFHSKLCIYSGSVEQLHTNYSLEFSGADQISVIGGE